MENYQVNTPEKGWNDAPSVILRNNDKIESKSVELIELIKNVKELKPLLDDLQSKNVDVIAISLIYDYLTTGSKSHYQKLVANYFENYTWIPILRKVKLPMNK